MDARLKDGSRVNAIIPPLAIKGPCITIQFNEHKQSVALPAKKVIETAFNALKSSNTEPGFYRKQCWEVIKCYLVASLQADDEKSHVLRILPYFSISYLLQFSQIMLSSLSQ